MASKHSTLPETIIIEPRTQITTFDGIPWGIQRAVGGAIAHLLYGDDKKLRDSYYKGKIGRKNKSVLRELSSQVYSYVDGTISEYSDLSDFVFRVWTQIFVNRKSGEIEEKPVFDVEIFKYIGQFAARPIETENFALDIIFVGKKDDPFISPFFNKLLRKVKSSTKYVNLDTYNDPSAVREELKSLLIEGMPTLIIEKEAFPIKNKNDVGTSSIQMFIEDDNGKPFNVKDEKDLMLFISKKSGLKPDIMGLRTAFQPVDDDMKKISKSVRESFYVESSEDDSDYVQKFGMEESLKNLEEKLNEMVKTNIEEKKRRELNILKNLIDETKKKFRSTKSDYEATSLEIKQINEDFDQNKVQYEVFDITRSKHIKNLKRLETELVELQMSIKSEITTKIDDFILSAQKTIGES